VKKLVLTTIAALFSASVALADSQTGIDAFNSKEFDTALAALQPAAETGDVEAMYYLGQMHAAGFGVEKDLKKALGYYRTAADLGHAPSQKELGTALALGEGVEQDVAEGLKWLLIASRTGDESAKEYAQRITRFMSRTVVLTARREATQWQNAFEKKNAEAQPAAQ
jgi:uncharacterized protein